MKFRKLLLCMIAGLFLTNFANGYTYAAEENVVTEETTNDVNANQVTDTTITADTTATDILQEDANKAEADAKEKADKEAAAKEAEAKEKAAKEAAAKKAAEKEAAAKKEAAEKAAEKAAAKKAAAEKEAAKENYSKADLRLLSALIYCEANAESYNGKLAVGIVVMNRVRSGIFPDSVKSVIYQKYQFGPVNNGALSKKLADYDNGKFNDSYEVECIKAAKEALSGAKSITVNGKSKDFSKYLFFSGRLRNATYNLGHHQFK